MSWITSFIHSVTNTIRNVGEEIKKKVENATSEVKEFVIEHVIEPVEEHVTHIIHPSPSETRSSSSIPAPMSRPHPPMSVEVPMSIAPNTPSHSEPNSTPRSTTNRSTSTSRSSSETSVTVSTSYSINNSSTSSSSSTQRNSYSNHAITVSSSNNGEGNNTGLDVVTLYEKAEQEAEQETGWKRYIPFFGEAIYIRNLAKELEETYESIDNPTLKEEFREFATKQFEKEKREALKQVVEEAGLSIASTVLGGALGSALGEVAGMFAQGTKLSRALAIAGDYIGNVVVDIGLGVPPKQALAFNAIFSLVNAPKVPKVTVKETSVPEELVSIARSPAKNKNILEDVTVITKEGKKVKTVERRTIVREGKRKEMYSAEEVVVGNKKIAYYDVPSEPYTVKETVEVTSGEAMRVLAKNTEVSNNIAPSTTYVEHVVKQNPKLSIPQSEIEKELELFRWEGMYITQKKELYYRAGSDIRKIEETEHTFRANVRRKGNKTSFRIKIDEDTELRGVTKRKKIGDTEIEVTYAKDPETEVLPIQREKVEPEADLPSPTKPFVKKRDELIFYPKVHIPNPAGEATTKFSTIKLPDLDRIAQDTAKAFEHAHEKIREIIAGSETRKAIRNKNELDTSFSSKVKTPTRRNSDSKEQLLTVPELKVDQQIAKTISLADLGSKKKKKPLTFNGAMRSRNAKKKGAMKKKAKTFWEEVNIY
ncbi:MAG: hypothetical protein DSY42_01730 [Aquifex sp.]|nr:MAG: hypothetical protein DSY42_01730 [Aquifex sp.]